jgi:hypothetical protein
MFHSHLGDDPTATANPAPTLIDTGNLPLQPAVVPLTNPAQALPTNGADPLATSDAQMVPTTPASPMQATPMAPLAVMDPNQYQAPQILQPMVVTAPKVNWPLILLGGGLVAYLCFGGKGRGASSGGGHRRAPRGRTAYRRKMSRIRNRV